MRTTLDLPDPVLRNLKIQAAQSGKSLKALLNELILRAMATPASPASGGQPPPPALPVLSRLSQTSLRPESLDDGANVANLQLSQLDAELKDDLDKLRRSGFIR